MMNAVMQSVVMQSVDAPFVKIKKLLQQIIFFENNFFEVQTFLDTLA
jgi:hypothetical protein